MATEEIAVKITADAGQANQSVGSFKAQLREATAELVNMAAKFGEGSVQAQNAAKKVANLKDAIGDAKALADTFNPDKKFVALGGALQGAVGGFTALQGAMGLFGSESKQVEQLLLKVQSAMALQQGISAIFSAKDSFKLLGTEIKLATVFTKASTAATAAAAAVQKLFTGAVTTTSTAFKVLKTAIISTGIGALIVLAGTLIGKIMEWNDSTEDAKKQQDELAEATKRADAALSQQVDTLSELTDIQVKRARIAGASEAEINKIQSDGIQQRINLINDEITARIKAGQSFTELSKQLGELQNQQTNQQLDFELKAAEKSRENAKQAASKKAQDAKSAAEKARNEQKADNEAAEKQLKELRQENFLNEIADEKARAEEKALIDFQNASAELEKSKANKETKDAILLQLEQKYLLDLKKIADDAAAEKKKKDDELAEEEKQKEEQRKKDVKAALDAINQIRIDAISDQFQKQFEQEDLRFEKEKENLQKQFDDKLITEEQRRFALENLEKIHAGNLTKIIKDRNDTTQQIEEKAFEARMKLMDALGSGLSTLSDLVGKETATGKALAVASSLINTYSAIAGQLKAFSGVPVPGYAIAQAVVTGLVGFKAVRDIIKTPVPGGKGGGISASVPSAGAAVAQAAPVLPQAQTTRIDQAQINQIGNAAVRSYVLETDVANNQERRIRIERAARIG